MTRSSSRGDGTAEEGGREGKMEGGREGGRERERDGGRGEGEREGGRELVNDQPLPVAHSPQVRPAVQILALPSTAQEKSTISTTTTGDPLAPPTWAASGMLTNETGSE